MEVERADLVRIVLMRRHTPIRCCAESVPQMQQRMMYVEVKELLGQATRGRLAGQT